MDSQPRPTPACAGNTCHAVRLLGEPQAYPRLRGEHWPTVVVLAMIGGLPPLARGTHSARHGLCPRFFLLSGLFLCSEHTTPGCGHAARSDAGMTAIPSFLRYAPGPVVITAASRRSWPIF